MNLNKIIYLFLGAALFISCNKNPAPNPSPTPVDTLPIVISPSVSPIIYVGGDTTIGSGRTSIPVFWKNGNATILSNSIGLSNIKSLVLNGSDIYCLLTYGAAGIAYWKNNIRIDITIDPSIINPTANSLTVSGNNAYLSGNAGAPGTNTNNIPVYWKNNEIAIHLAPIGGSISTSIFANGNDVYVTGQTIDPSCMNFCPNTAIYWKNGLMVHLPAVPAFVQLMPTSSIANALVVVGSDVYVAGIILPFASNSFATYWKNGVQMPLTSSNTSIANSIVVSGTDVYVTGGIIGSNNLTEAVYWKNGVPVYLTNSTALRQNCLARSIAINGNDVYVAGNIGEYGATYWKNGVAVPLVNANGYGHAYSIAIGK